MDFSCVLIRYFFGYVYHICLKDTIQSTLSLCLLCQAMLLPMPLRPLLLTTRSGFVVAEAKTSLLGVWHRGKRSVQDIVDQIQIKIPSPGGIADGVQVPTLRTSSALTPSTGQEPQKRAKPQVATNPKFQKSPNVPIGAPHPRDPAGVPELAGREIDGHPQRAISGPQLPIMGSGTVTSAENRAVTDSSTGVIERTNAAPSRTSPMGPIVVDSGTPLSLGGLPEPQVRRNLFAAPLMTNSTLKTVESSRSRLIPNSICVRLESPWP